MKLKNTSKISRQEIRKAINFVRPSGISNFDIWVKKGVDFCGRAYYHGCAFGNHFRPYVVVRTNLKLVYPRVYEREGGYLRITVYSNAEALVFIVAHELRHLWQARHVGWRYYGSKGRFSERDADCYALHKLREWRRTGRII